MAKKKPKTDIPADFQSVDMETVASPHPEVAYDLALHFGANIVGSDEYSVTLQRGQTMVSVNTVQGFDEAVKALGYWFN